MSTKRELQLETCGPTKPCAKKCLSEEKYNRGGGGGAGGGGEPTPGTVPVTITITGSDPQLSSSPPASGTPPAVSAQLPGANDTGQVTNSKTTCCFCWCCCCSCSCNNGKMRSEHHSNSDSHQQLSPTDIWGENSPPTVEEIRAWGESFDELMKHSAGRKVFGDFLKCEYSEENILFWLACEELKKESEAEQIEEKARLIYEDYISILSPREVSLDSRVRDIINKNMVAGPNASTFDEAQLQIYTLMHRDSYPRFVNSAVYRKIAQLPTPSRKGSAA